MKYIRSLAVILSLLLLLSVLPGCGVLKKYLGGESATTEPIRDAVTLHVNGETYGTVNRINGTVTLPGLTAPAGYEIDAWYADAACTTAYANGNDAYARYLPISYTLTFDPQNGDAPKTVAYTVESPDYTESTPVRGGYTFLGWNVDGGTDRYATVTVPNGSTGNHTFVAAWKPTVYQISYDIDGGTLLHENPSVYTVEDSFTLNNPSRLGYFFLGWECDGALCASPCTINVGTTGDLSFRAVWSKTVYTLSVASALPEAAVTTALGEDVLDINTPVRVTAPLLQGTNRFAGWECNGDIVSGSPVYEFLMPAKSVSLRAIYREIPSQPYDLSSGEGLLFRLPDESVPTGISGCGLRFGVDTETRADGVAVSRTFLSHLEPGLHLFYLVSDTSNGYLFLNVTGSAPAASSAARPDDPKFLTYFERSLTYGGKTYPYAASTPEEFRTLTEYFTLVEGVLQAQATPGKSDFEFTFLIYGDLYPVIINKPERDLLLDAAFKQVSFPMSPSLGSKWKQWENGIEFTLTIHYKGLNTDKGGQPTSTFPDIQGYLSTTGRSEDFNAFPIDALTDTINVRTLFELERLPFGYRPTFAGTAADAAEVYEAARAILRRIVDGKMDDYAKIVAIYAWLGENVTYDYSTISVTSARAFTVYGALIDRLAVCDGYASAFRLLCQIEGIRSEEYTGVNEVGVPSTGHAWNKVWVGGAVFGIDATWARPNSSANFVTPQYLFLDEAGLLATDHYENAWEGAGSVQVCATPGFDFLTSVETAPGFDLVIGSSAEMDAAISYLKTTGKKFLLFRFENGMGKGDLSSALERAHLSCSYGILGENYGYIER